MHPLVRQAEKIRKGERVALIDFVKELRISISTYYKWISMNREPNNKNKEDVKEWIIKKGRIPVKTSN